ncbi:MAG: efflux transporter outer membrane subunit [Proteobacteria bacterium]|nr:efflux transporter outer membrane subunit [Pseudomonadota bacterium]
MKINSRHIAPRILGVIFSLLLTSCTAVGPNYQPPQQEVPPHWQATNANIAEPTAGPVGETWWTLFNDSLLDTLVAEATAANLNLRKAEARIREARAQRIIAGATGSLGAATSASTARRSDNTSSASGTQDLFQIGLDARWELDLFGGLQRATESADASLAASHEEMRDVLVSLQAEVARNYLEMRGSQKRLATTHNNITTQEKTVALVQGRFQMGLGNELDLMNAKTQLSLTKAALPPLARSIRQTMHQLAILLGKAPANLITRLSGEGPGLTLPQQIPINLPSDLLRQRPDIRVAERRLAAATADIGVATADLFPKFSLTGLLGLQSNSLSDLVTSGSRYWSIGPTISLALFNRGKVRAGIEVKNARRDQAFADYQQTVLSALGEVENGLVAFSLEQETLGILKDAVISGERAVTIANGLYEAGLSDFLNVLQSERALFQSQDQMAQSEQRLTLSLVAIFKALGGGWQNQVKSEATVPAEKNELPDMQKPSTDTHPT